MRRLKKIGIAILLLILAWVLWRVTLGTDLARTQALMRDAGLGELPLSASNVMFRQWNGLFTGETHAKFQVSAGDLQKLMEKAASLPGHKVEIFTPAHQFLPFGEKPDDSQGEPERFDRRQFEPWFDPTIRQRGRRYILYRGPDMWVVVNEENNTVFLVAVKG